MSFGGLGGRGSVDSLSSWLPTADSTSATIFADFLTEGTTNHYYASGQNASAAAWLTAASGTFTRASAQSRADAQAKLQSVTNNVMAFDHDPLTGAAVGLRNPPASTNGLRNNSNTGVVTGVVGSGGNIGTNNTVATTAGLTYEVIAFGTDADNNRPYMDLKMSGTTSATASVIHFGATNHFAAVQGETVTLSMGWKLVAGALTNISSFYTTIVERNSGSSQLSGISTTIGSSPTSIYAPFSQTLTLTQATTAFVQARFGLNFASGVAVDITLRIYLDNLEKQPYPTPRIPTTSVEVTRAAPTMAFTRTSPTALSVAIKARTPAGSGTNVLWQIDDGTAANRLRIVRNASNEIHFIATVGSSDVADINLGTVANSTVFRVAFRAAANDFAACLNGGSVSTDTVGSMPAGMVNGRISGDSASSNQWAGTIASLSEWTGVSLTNSALQGALA